MGCYCSSSIQFVRFLGDLGLFRVVWRQGGPIQVMDLGCWGFKKVFAGNFVWFIVGKGLFSWSQIFRGCQGMFPECFHLKCASWVEYFLLRFVSVDPLHI